MTDLVCKICGKKGFKNKKSLSNHTRWHNPTERLKMSVTRENNPNWQGGKCNKNKLERDSEQYRQWRIQVMERDDYTCQICRQVGGNLEVHHIKSFAKFKELRYILDNGITLCKKCHSDVDKYRSLGD